MLINSYAFQVGSFLMGWWGVVFKGDISKVSDYLVIGLNTGYLGSLTTFSGWNQKMLDLTVDGHWVLTFLGFFIGNEGHFLVKKKSSNIELQITGFQMKINMFQLHFFCRSCFSSRSDLITLYSLSLFFRYDSLQACFLRPILLFLGLRQPRVSGGF